MPDHVVNGMSGFWVQCIHGGHIYELVAGDPLIERCKERARNGTLDALILTSSECRHCRDDREQQMRREVRLCSDAGCPMGEDDCKYGCMVAAELRDFLKPQPAVTYTGPEKILRDPDAKLHHRTKAARQLGWTVIRKTRGTRKNKEFLGIVFRDKRTNERIRT